MKNTLFIILAAILTLSSCSKDDTLQQEMNRLRGTWELKSITGGIAGTGYDANFDKLMMNNENHYSLLADGNSVQEGSYTLTIENDNLVIRFQPDAEDNITFDEFEKSVQWENNDRKLILSEPCCDLFVYIFERIQN